MVDMAGSTRRRATPAPSPPDDQDRTHRRHRALFVINQLDVVIRGAATPVVWLKIALTYVVPFCVSNLGILIASRRVETRDHKPGAAEVMCR